MNEHLASKLSGFCVTCKDAGEGCEQGCGSFANLGFGFLRCSTSCIPAVVRNSLLLRAIRRLEKFAGSKFSRQPRRGELQGGDELSEYFEYNLLRPELIRGSLKKENS